MTKLCTFPMGRGQCHRWATSAVKSEGRLFFYRCEEHKGMRANGERGEVLIEGIDL